MNKNDLNKETEIQIEIDPDVIGNDLITIDHILPKQLHIIPLRYRPIFPGIVAPLVIANKKLTGSINSIFESTRTIGIVLLKDDDVEKITGNDIYRYGIVAKILKKINLPDDGMNLLINTIKRFKITKVVSEKPDLIVEVEYLDDEVVKKDMEIKALTRAVLSQLKVLSDNNPFITEEMKLTMINADEPGRIADFATTMINCEKKECQQVLEAVNIKDRLMIVLQLLQKEMNVLNLQKKIQSEIYDKIDKQQKEFFLREQLKAIKSELGMETDEKTRDLNTMKKKLDELELKGEVKEKAEDELTKLSLIDPNSSEYPVTRNYIETILSLPWNQKTKDSYDIVKAEKILNKDHYGLDDVKLRILEFLAVKKLKK